MGLIRTNTTSWCMQINKWTCNVHKCYAIHSLVILLALALFEDIANGRIKRECLFRDGAVLSLDNDWLVNHVRFPRAILCAVALCWIGSGFRMGCCEVSFMRTLCVSFTRTLCVSFTRTLCVSFTRTLCVSFTRMLCVSFTRTLCVSSTSTQGCEAKGGSCLQVFGTVEPFDLWGLCSRCSCQCNLCVSCDTGGECEEVVYSGSVISQCLRQFFF